MTQLQVYKNHAGFFEKRMCTGLKHVQNIHFSFVFDHTALYTNNWITKRLVLDLCNTHTHTLLCTVLSSDDHCSQNAPESHSASGQLCCKSLSVIMCLLISLQYSVLSWYTSLKQCVYKMSKISFLDNFFKQVLWAASFPLDIFFIVFIRKKNSFH